MKKAVVYLGLCVFLWGCQSFEGYPPNVRPSSLEAPKQIEYRAGVDDVLGIVVWRYPEYTTDVIVGPDGKIYLPLIKEIVADGKTIKELTDELTKRYGEYLVSPDISITVKKVAGQKVFVFGEVAKPGVYNFTGPKYLVDILGEAGGWSKDAKLTSVVVVKGDITAAEPEVILVNVDEILHGKLRNNIIIYSKDIVFVPPTVISDVRRFVSDYFGPLQNILTTIVTIDYFKSK